MHQYFYFIILCLSTNLNAQNVVVKGRVLITDNTPLSGVEISENDQKINTITDALGYFEFALKLDEVYNKELTFKLEGYKTLIVPFQLQKSLPILELGVWFMTLELYDTGALEVFDLQHEDFDNLEDDRSQFLGALQARRTVFLEAAAFQFSSSFFSARGLDSKHQEIRINGIRMNSFENGRAVWSSWGGLNDFTNRAQQNGFGIQSSGAGFGGVLGYTSFNLRPSGFRRGSKISQAFSNTSYRFRTMISHHSGMNKKQWAYSFLFSSRWGTQGYVNGTSYKSFSGLFMIEKKWTPRLSSWFSAIYTPTSRGRNAPLTEEVFRIKGKQYNPYWGIDKSIHRNTRLGKTETPILILNHEWTPSYNIRIQLNTAYQFGETANSRLSYTGASILENTVIGGARNPDPVYYQNLPSYFLRNPLDQDFSSAYLADQHLRNSGQIDWESIRLSNLNSTQNDARYFLYDDIKNEKKFSGSLSFLWNLKPEIKWQTELIIIQSLADYYARTTDLLEANQIIDVDLYATDLNSAQNNLLNPNAVIELAEKFQYSYQMGVNQFELATYWSKEVGGYSLYIGGRYNYSQYQRTGYFQNGGFPNSSLGSAEPINFTSWSGKIGGSLSLSGRHQIQFNGLFSSQPPTLRNTFSNPRNQNQIIPNITIEQTLFFTTKYHWQAPWFDLQLLAYWGIEQKGTQLSFYFADGVGGDEAFFIQEVLHNVEKKHQGLEFGWKVTLADVIQIKLAFAVGIHQYGNNPDLSLYTAPTDASKIAGFENGHQNFGSSQLAGYFLRAGPQQAYSVGFEYSDPTYWRIGVFGNYFARNFLSPNPLRRSQNFYTDGDGIIFPEYNNETASNLLAQEQFPSYFLLNATGGKSWKVENKYFGFFISLQNLLNTTYKTGGFEQGRNANYRNVTEDNLRSTPLFAPKYWWGRGTTFFTSIYYRF